MSVESPPSSIELSIKSDPNLLAEGWVRRYLADPQRTQESKDLYESLGFEVLAHPLQPSDFGPNCQGCASIVCRSYVMIYTRKKTPEAGV